MTTIQQIIAAALIAAAITAFDGPQSRSQDAAEPDDTITIEHLPVDCTTDSECEAAADYFGCEELAGFGFACYGPRYRAALARHSA